MKKASKNLQASQELQKQWHDQKAVLMQYQPGQKVWVLEPVTRRALQDKWSEPHLIVEKKGEVTYLVVLGAARSPLRVIHVNRLKPYYERADLTLLMATDEGQEEESDPLPDLFSSTEEDALVEGVVLADWLTAELKDNCIHLLGQFSELFSTVPGTTSWCEHTIDTGDSMPVKSKIYRQHDHIRDCIKQEVQKMLDLGVVEPSESPWASPVVLAPKSHSKDGKREGEDSVNPQEISSELLVQEGGRLPQSMHHQETGEKAARMKRYKVAVVVLATLLLFCRRPEQSAVDPLAEGDEGDAEELW
ncbi:hypothetical protein NDU88_006680 [Pleurodeles waltl]|uniref:Integrase p58-like C-terminal domain-containing protein n=1 Tax=Pleurodeles waltl TaxID=8319 RepID=A0AAV7NV45_PLEWA|nr:hypothetical protein NDU88_006680 [Pleurodeles waltl]